MKTKKETYKTSSLKLNIARQEKHIWYCELIISACVGASIVLAFVIAHQMIVTEWVW